MKILLDIQDHKALQFLEAIKSLPYIKMEQITEEKAELIGEIKEAVDELKLILTGNKKARDADDFLNEL